MGKTLLFTLPDERLFTLPDERRRSHSPDEPALRPSHREPTDHLWNLGEREVDTLIDRLRELGSEDLRQLASELREELEEATADEYTARNDERCKIEAALPATASPLPPVQPRLIADPISPPALEPSLMLAAQNEILEPDLPPVPRPELIGVPSVHQAPASKRSPPRSRRLGLPLAAAVIAMAVPWNYPSTPSPSDDRAGLATVTPEQPLLPVGEPSLSAPATASTAVPRSSTPSPPENIGPEAEPVAGVTRGREDIELLMQRGDHFLATRDVVSARSFYERAAAAGSTDAAFAMARTFDAQFLTQIGATHVRPDAERAAAWDHAAGAVGDHLMDAQLPAPRSPSGN